MDVYKTLGYIVGVLQTTWRSKKRSSFSDSEETWKAYKIEVIKLMCAMDAKKRKSECTVIEMAYFDLPILSVIAVGDPAEYSARKRKFLLDHLRDNSHFFAELDELQKNNCVLLMFHVLQLVRQRMPPRVYPTPPDTPTPAKP